MKKKIWGIFCLAALALALVLPAWAAIPRPADANFTYGAKLTVAGYQSGKPALPGFPVLVRISEGSPSGFSYNNVQNKSATDWDDIDLAFIDMIGNGLPFEIDTWDPNGTSLVWVKLPTMINGTEFVMCWGSTSSGRDICDDKPWGGYAGVWHMNEATDGAVTIYDATDNHLDATATSGSYAQPSGVFGGARTPTKNGKNKDAQCIAVDLSEQAKRDAVDGINTEANGHSFTVSMWVKPVKYQGDGIPASQYLVGRKYEDRTPAWGIQYHYISANSVGSKDYSRIRTWGSETAKGDNDMLSFDFDNSVIPSTASSCLGKWFKYDVVYSGNTVTFYVNGGTNELAILAGTLIAPPAGNSEYLYLAGTPATGKVSGVDIGTREFEGDMDEVRLRGGAMTADWIAADWAAQTDPDFLTASAAEEYVETDDPIAGLSMTSVQYTNATASVAVNYLGASAISATVHIDFAADDAFTSIVKSAEVAVADPGNYNISVIGLSYGMTYYVRAMITNNQNRTSDLGTVSFTTLTPGAPAGTAVSVLPGYTTFGTTATVTGFGTGAESATMWLEASTTDDFSTFVSGTAETAIVGTAAELSVSGLSPDTAYSLRVRIRNNWGTDTIVPLTSTSTRAVPFATTGLVFAEGAGGTIDFTFPVTDIYDGATVEAVLTYNGIGAGAQSTSVPATLSWAGVAAASGPETATVVATATLPNDGGTVTKEWTVALVPGAACIVVADVLAHASAASALWVRLGDVVILPEATGNVSYQVLNERFASVEGNALTALEPGIVGVRCVDAACNTNIMGVVVLPDAIGSGSVYVYDETKWNASSWTDATAWKKVDGDTRSAAASNDSYPKNADDIAILPFYNRTGSQYIRHRADITIGGLYTGMIRPDVTGECVLERYEKDTTKTVTFQRADGQPVLLQVCPNGYHGTFQSQLRLGGYSIDVVWASDAVIDCGSSETEYMSGPVGTFNVPNTTPPCTNTLQNVTLTVQGLPGRNINGAGATREFHGIWKGTGTIVKKGQGGIAFQGDLGGFSGSFMLKGEKNLGGIAPQASQISVRGGGATNLAATVHGVVEVSSNGGITQNNAAGLFGTSLQVGAAPPITDAAATFNGESGPRGPDAPAKGLSLFGGTWYAGRIDNKTWGVGVCDNKVLDELHIGAGCSVIVIQGANGNNNGYPINVITAKSLRQTDRGTFAVNEGTRQKQTPPAVTNSLFFVENWADYATGADGNSFTSSVHPIIPWMISPMNSDWSNVAFASFDEDGRLLYEVRDNCQITLAPSEDANLYMTGKNLNYGTAGGDYTINSLYISNGSNNRWLGAGRTLCIKSGGLILQGQSAIGLPGRTDNGALVLGDATHPAYVWAKAYKAGETNYLGAAVTAAGGFVSAYPGNLCLVGDQTGIADEIAVNAGTLAIGTAAADCSIAVGIPIRVCAGASLLLPTVTNSVAASPIKLDSAGKNFAKIILPVDQTCASLAVRYMYESSDWSTLPKGTYGSSESSAEFVRDDLFVGPGVLTVGEAKARGVRFLIY